MTTKRKRSSSPSNTHNAIKFSRHDSTNTTKGESKAKDRDKDKANRKRQYRQQAHSNNATNHPGDTSNVIRPGDAGIWATCAMGKEGRTVLDLRDLFEDVASRHNISPSHATGEGKAGDTGAATGGDIEASIQDELASLQQAGPASSKEKEGRLFEAVKLNTPCILFFRTRAPIEPVEFVRTVCLDWSTPTPDSLSRNEDERGDGTGRRGGCAYVKRLTPMSRMGRASMDGLKEVCSIVLPLVFGSTHTHDGDPTNDDHRKTFAIRPTIRNNNNLKRDDVIKLVAGLVGPPHRVDLKEPEVVVLVEVYQNVLGMAVVEHGREFERLKRYNLAEIGTESSSSL